MTSNIEELIKSRDFPPLKNDAILKVAKGETPHRLPVWIMRQAGRYLPEFQKLRAKYDFFEICETAELACDVTLMPIERFDLDAAIIFSDILVIPKALGMEVLMRPGVGPVIPKPLTLETLDDLKFKGAVDRLKYVGRAITLTRHKLMGKVPLIGFSGAPWTLMGYMIEGGGSKTLAKSKKWLYAHPKESHQLLSLLTETIIDYLVMQVEAGAQILQIFDSSAEYLNKELYNSFVISGLQEIRFKVREKLKLLQLEDVPMILFAKGAWFSLEDQGKLGYEVIGLDWTIPPEYARLILPGLTVQGNLDPCALYEPEEVLRQHVALMLQRFGPNRHIVNLGHGIYPDVDVKAVEVFIDAVHNAG